MQISDEDWKLIDAIFERGGPLQTGTTEEDAAVERFSGESKERTS
jgi:hypothetical protein